MMGGLECVLASEIVAEPERLKPLLQELANQRRTVILTGQTDAERCSCGLPRHQSKDRAHHRRADSVSSSPFPSPTELD
jgi:hypothetical protein